MVTQNAAPSDWSAARGEKWRAQLTSMEAMLAPVDPVLIQALHLDAPYRIADVACGGGGTTLEILRQAPAKSIVHGFDISPALIEAARARTSPDQRSVAFHVANMATAQPPEGPYDRLASRFGVMFFDDPQAAFLNLFDWLKLGGRCAFAVWSPLSENPWMTTLRAVVAEFVDIPPLDPEAPGPFRYAEAGKLTTLLDRAGFREIDVRDWHGALRVGGGLNAADAAGFALASFSSFSEQLAAAGEATLAAARQSLTARLSPHQQDGIVQMSACAHIVTGGRLQS